MKTSNNLRIFGEALDTILLCKQRAEECILSCERVDIAYLATGAYNTFEKSINNVYNRDKTAPAKYEPMLNLLEGFIGDIFSSAREAAA